MIPSQQQIDRVRNWATEKIERGGSHFPGMTYEEGVEAALRWVAGETEDAPDE